MPSRKAHEYASKVMFGDPYTMVHQLLDFPARFGEGRRHRRFYHDEDSARYLAGRFGDQRVYSVCKLHFFLDNHRDSARLDELVSSGHYVEAQNLVRSLYSAMASPSPRLTLPRARVVTNYTPTENRIAMNTKTTKATQTQAMQKVGPIKLSPKVSEAPSSLSLLLLPKIKVVRGGGEELHFIPPSSPPWGIYQLVPRKTRKR